MKQTLLTICLIVFALSSWGETLTMNDLVIRDNLYYKKFTNVPFTGEISGLENGSFEKGKKNGPWENYHTNGQLWVKGNYKDGIRDGFWEAYFDDGQSMYKANYKDGKPDGLEEMFDEDGNLTFTYEYKDGELIE